MATAHRPRERSMATVSTGPAATRVQADGATAHQPAARSAWIRRPHGMTSHRADRGAGTGPEAVADSPSAVAPGGSPQARLIGTTPGMISGATGAMANDGFTGHPGGVPVTAAIAPGMRSAWSRLEQIHPPDRFR